MGRKKSYQRDILKLLIGSYKQKTLLTITDIKNSLGRKRFHQTLYFLRQKGYVIKHMADREGFKGYSLTPKSHKDAQEALESHPIRVKKVTREKQPTKVKKATKVNKPKVNLVGEFMNKPKSEFKEIKTRSTDVKVTLLLLFEMYMATLNNQSINSFHVKNIHGEKYQRSLERITGRYKIVLKKKKGYVPGWQEVVNYKIAGESIEKAEDILLKNGFLVKPQNQEGVHINFYLAPIFLAIICIILLAGYFL